MKFKKGIYKDISSKEYHDDRDYVSSSVFKDALESSKLFYKKYVLNEEVKVGSQSALDFGNYMHAKVLEPHTIATDFAFWSKTKRGKEWETFKAKNAGKIIISDSQVSMADQIMLNFHKTEVALSDKKTVSAIELFDGGEAETSVFSDIGGLDVKVRFDYVVEDGDGLIIRDLKTTSSNVSTRAKAKKVMEDMQYNLSGALYLDVAEKVYKKPCRFQLVFAQKSNYEIFCYEIGKVSLENGRKEYKRASKLIKKWRKTGKYFENTIEVI